SFYDSVHSRLSGGLLPPVDYIIEAHGTNDAVSGTLSQVAASVQGLLTSLRAAAPRANILQIVPLGLSGSTPYAESQITSGFNAYRTSTGDQRVFLVDVAAANGNIGFNQLVTTYPGAYMSDIRHPSAAGHALAISQIGPLSNSLLNAAANQQSVVLIRR
ncbi:MAG TPA: SGNH/GDSL hydrolase family protein, partial [Nevskia sp.]|nr:SGNH/GDSL hydrolase family protein [Nevskia sp.]